MNYVTGKLDQRFVILAYEISNPGRGAALFV